MTGKIFNVQKFSIHDGPGIRTTVFFKGCPLACEWCANPESQNKENEILADRTKCVKCKTCKAYAENYDDEGFPVFDFEKNKENRGLLEICPKKAIAPDGEDRDIDEIVGICLQDKDFYEESGGGVTVSGGEAMIQPEALEELIKKLKENGINTAIETTGYVENDVFKKLAPMFDHILYDIKHYNDERHSEGTGVTMEKILENLSWGLNEGLDILVRIPVIPFFNDSTEDAEGFAKLFDEIGVTRVQLLPFHQFGEGKYDRLGRNYKYRKYPNLHPEDLQDFKDVLIESGIDCFI